MRLLAIAGVLAYAASSRPPAFEEMAEAERAFVRRAQEVSVHQAFMEFFADDVVGFQTGVPASWQADMRKRPVQPRDPNVLFWWEPRYGDIAASGELGWLTGPVRSGRKDEPAKVRHGNYASVWKRQADGRFKVVIDIGIDPPGEVPFPPGLTRMPFEKRFSGDEIAPLALASLGTADRAFNTAAISSLAAAYDGAAAPAIRIHRNGHLPIEGRAAALAWAARQPALPGESLFTETAASADLGYTWGSYEKGHYVRVWVRDAQRAWHLALDLDAPKPARP